jgi:hypothetical protein
MLIAARCLYRGESAAEIAVTHRTGANETVYFLQVKESVSRGSWDGRLLSVMVNRNRPILGSTMARGSRRMHKGRV